MCGILINKKNLWHIQLPDKKKMLLQSIFLNKNHASLFFLRKKKMLVFSNDKSCVVY